MRFLGHRGSIFLCLFRKTRIDLAGSLHNITHQYSIGIFGFSMALIECYFFCAIGLWDMFRNWQGRVVDQAKQLIRIFKTLTSLRLQLFFIA
jgi:hypothetical protein